MLGRKINSKFAAVFSVNIETLFECQLVNGTIISRFSKISKICISKLWVEFSNHHPTGRLNICRRFDHSYSAISIHDDIWPDRRHDHVGVHAVSMH